jgi:hypothetical protein
MVEIAKFGQSKGRPLSLFVVVVCYTIYYYIITMPVTGTCLAGAGIGGCD